MSSRKAKPDKSKPSDCDLSSLGKSQNGNRKDRREEEKEIIRKVKRKAAEPSDKVSWKKKAGGVFFVLFLGGVGLFNFISTVGGFLVGTGIQNLDVQDTTKLKSVLFGGDPWLIYCVNNETENQRLPSVIEESRSVAGGMGLSIGVLRCWDQTSSGRSVAQRFKMNLKPPLLFVVANGNQPRTLNLVGISKPEDLQKRVSPALKLDTIRIDALKKWPTSCTSRRTCIVIGHKNNAQRDVALNLFKPLLEKHRSTRIVTLDTSFWQLKLDEGVLATRHKDGQKRAEVLCLARADAGAEDNSTHRGTFLRDLDASSAATFTSACEKQLDLVSIKMKPKIKARPSKPKVVKPPRPTSRPAPRPRPPPPAKKHSKKADYVGSRASLEEEEPLFEAVEDEEAGDTDDADAEAGDSEAEDADEDDSQDSDVDEEDSSDEVEL